MTSSRLGKGLSSLIPSRSARSAAGAGADVHKVPIAKIHANPRQPRTHMHADHLDDLARSIREHGILQPLVVTEVGDGYEIIAGERRFRAAQMVGLTSVPVVIRSASDQDKLSLALVENLQRQDLNPLEEARAFNQLIADFNLTQEDVGLRVGKSRSYIANALRLLLLPTDVQSVILDGKLSEGHAKVLLRVKDPVKQRALLQRMLHEKLSVRKGEALTPTSRSSAKHANDANMEAKERALSHALGTKVSITGSASRGEIHITYFSNEELNGILERISSQ